MEASFSLYIHFVYTFCVVNLEQICYSFNVKIDGVDIDKGNKEKLLKHVVSLEEIILFFSEKFYVLKDKNHSIEESRFIGFSELNGRSTRYAHKKEIEKLYEKIQSE